MTYTHSSLIIRRLGQSPYLPIWKAMQAFTNQRQPSTLDELWLLQHDHVFTQGQAGKAEHILNPHDIPIIHTDRGGQVTYHAPGQLIAYILLDLRRQQWTIRQLVSLLENTVISLLHELGIEAHARSDAPGVYVQQQKICSIGLRVRRGCSYHGLALNQHMDLTPFNYINPCGFSNLSMTQLSALITNSTFSQLEQQFITAFCQIFGYTEQHYAHELPLEPPHEPTTTL